MSKHKALKVRRAATDGTAGDAAVMARFVASLEKLNRRRSTKRTSARTGKNGSKP